MAETTSHLGDEHSFSMRYPKVDARTPVQSEISILMVRHGGLGTMELIQLPMLVQEQLVLAKQTMQTMHASVKVSLCGYYVALLSYLSHAGICLRDNGLNKFFTSLDDSSIRFADCASWFRIAWDFKCWMLQDF